MEKKDKTEETTTVQRNENVITIYLKKIGQAAFGVAVEGDKVFAISFGTNEKNVLESLIESLPLNTQFQVAEESDAFYEDLLVALKAIYDGKDTKTNFNLTMKHLSKYSQKVLKCVWQIPAGYVASYGAVAKACGGASRAVGHVMATNPFAPVVPCHRIVQADFSIGGYGGGPELKLAILRREDRGYKDSKEIKTQCGVLLVHPVGKVLKKVGQETR
jgi:methylated-DNA-[protein]-cysteine S-methyltransferase